MTGAGWVKIVSIPCLPCTLHPARAQFNKSVRWPSDHDLEEDSHSKRNTLPFNVNSYRSRRQVLYSIVRFGQVSFRYERTTSHHIASHRHPSLRHISFQPILCHSALRLYHQAGSRQLLSLAYLALSVQFGHSVSFWPFLSCWSTWSTLIPSGRQSPANKGGVSFCFDPHQ